MVHLGSGYLQYFTHVASIWGQRNLYAMQYMDKDVPVTELHVLGSSSQARGKPHFDYALVVAKILGNDVVIQTASHSEVEILSAKGINLFS